MIRSSSLKQYELEVRIALQELFSLCNYKMLHEGDLLLCYQNGFIDYGNNPCVGIGKDGYDNLQKINSISFKGIGNITDDDNYFKQDGFGFFNGISTLEKEIHEEKNTYLAIWENAYFLRIFTQVVNIANKDHYDWNLEISKLPPNGKSKHIRERIINRLNISPKFHELIENAYVGQIRNAIAHSQYTLVQGGIIYNNYKIDKYSTLQGLTFEDWEKKYIYSYFIFNGIFQVLKQINNELYIPKSKRTSTKGIPVLIPKNEKEWTETYLYPNIKGDVWRFVKTIKD